MNEKWREKRGKGREKEAKRGGKRQLKYWADSSHHSIKKRPDRCRRFTNIYRPNLKRTSMLVWVIFEAVRKTCQRGTINRRCQRHYITCLLPTIILTWKSSCKCTKRPKDLIRQVCPSPELRMQISSSDRMRRPWDRASVQLSLAITTATSTATATRSYLDSNKKKRPSKPHPQWTYKNMPTLTKCYPSLPQIQTSSLEGK